MYAANGWTPVWTRDGRPTPSALATERSALRSAAVASPGTAVGGYGARPRPLAPRSTDEERAAHAAFIAKALKDKAVWLSFGVGIIVEG